jgi:uncharacterized membrane protein YgdD (TMEM256/DUF423 family)
MNATTPLAQKVALLFGSVLGGFGVMLAAAATHTADTHLLSNASAMALAHAPVLIAISLGWDKLRTAPAASIAMMLGCLLFIGDLLMRHFAGTGLFPMAAPIGGILMLASWFILAFSALLKAK